MYTKVNGEQQVQILSPNFSISPSNEDYVLNISANGKDFSPLFAVSAGVTRLVSNVAPGSYYKLVGNRSEVVINWQRMCATDGGGSGTELQPVADFPLNAVEGTVISYTGSSSASGVYQYDGTEWTAVGADIDLSAFWTSAETKTYVDSAVTDTQNQLNEISGMMQSKELVISTAFNQLSDEIDELSGRSVDMSAYYTSTQTEDAISAATSGKADAANLSAGDTNPGDLWFPKWNEQGIITGKAGQRNFQIRFDVNGIQNKVTSPDNGYIPSIWAPANAGTAGDILVSTGNGAPVWSAMTFITSADVETQIEAKGYITSADTADFLDAEDGLVISTALNDLDDRVDDVETSLATVETSLATKVSSTSVSTIWKGTQAEYDAIATKDPATFYIIVSSN